MKRIYLVLTVVFFLVFIQCSKSPKKELIPDSDFGAYISAFTSGTISVESPIVVKLAVPVKQEVKTGAEVQKTLFDFEPSINGKTVWIDNSTIQFIPDAAMKGGTLYYAKFRLGDIISTGKKMEKFSFSFSTIKQSFEITHEGLKTYSGTDFSYMFYKGSVFTADVISPEKIEAVINAKFENNKNQITWSHDPGQRKHFFRVDSLKRDNAASKKMVVEWDGKSIGSNAKGNKTFTIPALNDFKVIDASVEHSPQLCVAITFSDPLNSAQNLNGLITLEGFENLKFSIDQNLLKVWPGEELSGQRKLTVFQGIENAMNYSLKQDQSFLMVFENLKPEVKLIGKGVIVPQDGQLSMPFEAVSLNAVDLRIIQVYAQNMFRFLQDNNYDGSNELKKVGRLVYSGKVDLKPDNAAGFYQWNTYKINIGDYVELEQGAFYRVEIRFKRAYSLYGCEESEPEIETTEIEEKLALEADQKKWDSPGWYDDYYYPENYDWQQRNNPCSESYYNQAQFKSRNIFASNLGLIAKEGKGNSMIFVVTNLITTQPEAGVKLKVYDFQNQLLEELETGNNGIVSVDLAKKPFVLIAEKGNQTGYLRLDDGTALSLSNFNVSGQKVQHGLKGFIYGERGVWRPGDKLFLTFILEDKSQQLPENHPVIFKLINPRGQVVVKKIATLNNTGFYKFEIKTENDAPTGNWNAEVQVGSTLFSKRLKIETVKPNRLKINLMVQEVIQTSSSKSIELNAQWLHGTPAKSLKTTIDLNLTKGTTKFEGFEKYSFTDLASSFYTEEQEFFKGELNKEGNIDVPVNFSGIEKAPGMLQAYFTTKVFEEGGDFSINVQTAKISPYKKYVGVKMPDSEDNWFKTGTDYKAEIVCVDANGESVNTGLVEAELFKIDWRWWWESGDDNLAHYVNSRYQKPVAKWKINNINKKGALKINVKYRDWRDNGRYLLRVKDVNGGHASGVTFYMSKWGSWQADESAEGATMLSIKTEKETCKTGEKVKVIIPSSENSRALVSIESGSVVKDIFWVETKAQATTFEFVALPEMAPNVFVHVSLIQPYGQTKNDAPLRLYGVTPVLIEDPKTVLNPEIIVKDEIEPEEDYQVEVSEKIGSPMTYTLAVVDEGLLDLTNYRTPDPHSAFYAREALGVKTWDLYDMVAGAYGARLEKAFAVGGDENLLDRGKKKANRFKPVVEFIGPFSLQKGQSQKHTLKMPNYIGSVKVMVVAGNNGAYGNTDKVVKVRKGLMLLATVPRVLAPREKLVLPVTVFAYKNTIKKVKLKVKTNAFFEKSALLEKEITFDEQGEQVVYFELQVKDKTGQGKITVEASSGGEKASSETDINVTNPNPPLVLDKNAIVQPGTDWQAKIQKPGMEGTNQAWFEVSAIPSLNLSNHLENLINYPHGCIEQTVSAALAQLFLPKMAELDDYQKSTIEDNIRAALKRLMVFQLQDGGFSYWPGSSDSHSWGSSYAGHFMVLAEQQGYSLPFGIKKNWLRFQTYKAKNWVSKVNNSEGLVNNSNELDQAYRLYTLALVGNAEMGAMNRFREQVKSAAAKWRLAAAYGLAGQTKAAEELINGIPHSVGEYTELSGTFGNALRDKAMILETLILQKNRETAFILLKEISEELNEKSWLSTQTAAWCFYSASQFVDKMVAEGGINFQLKINGKTENISAKLPVLKMPVDFDQEGSVNIEFKNRNNNLVYARLVAKGIPIEGDYQTQDRQLNMNVWLANKSGEKIENNIFYQGDDVVLNVEVVHPGNRGAYEEMALTTALPSGFEILNQRLFDTPSENGNSFEYQDVRDSRIMTYFDIPSGNKKLFQFKVNTAYEGKYYFPPVVCEAMYNNAIYASTPGMWIEIIKQ